MTLLARLVLATLLFVTLLTGVEPSDHANAATSGIYIALGDSIAAGTGSSLPRTRGYVAIVGKRMQWVLDQSVSVENLAIPGETAESFLNDGQLARFQQRVSDATSAGIPVRAVSVSLGGNDMLPLTSSDDQQRQSRLDAFRASFASALQSIRTAIGADVPLVVTTYYDLSEGDASVPHSDAWWLAQFNSVINDVAAQVSANAADIAPAFAGHIDAYTLYPIDVHPTNEGHLAIADTVWQALGLDTSAPTIDVETTMTATRLTPTLRFAVSDNDSIEHVAVSSASGTLSQPLEVTEGSYVVLADFRGIAESSIVVTIQSEDPAGNVSSETVDVALPSGS